MEKTKVNFRNDSLMSSVLRNILEDCDSRMPDLRIICRDREVFYTHKIIMMLFPFLRDSLCSSPDSDTVILDVKKTQIQEQLKRIRSPDFTEADNSNFESEEKDDITDEQLMEIECAMNEHDEHLQVEPEHQQEVVHAINEANTDADTEEEDYLVLAENVTITPEISQHVQNEDMAEEETESVKNEPGMGACREIDNFLQKIKPKPKSLEEEKRDDLQESEGSKKPADDNIDSLLADSDEENKEPPHKSTKTSEQNQEFILCPYPKGICSKKWKKDRNTVQTKRAMKNHILKAHYANDFTRLLNASFTGKGTCKQCKKKCPGRIKQKKHLLENHKALQDEIAPLLQEAFPKTRRRRSNTTKDHSPLIPASSQKESSQIIEEIQSKLTQDLSDDSSDEDEEDIRSPKKSIPSKNIKDVRDQKITIDFGSDSDDE